MTNNKVIIDGVDVSNCEQYISKYQEPNNLEGGYKTFNKVCECGIKIFDNFNFYCKDNPICSFKQLARKTQECEKLKSALEEIEKLIKQIGGGSVYANGRYKEIQEFINKAKEQA